MEYLHVDIWIEGTFSPSIFVISSGTEVPHPITNTGANSWISIDIPVQGITADLTNAIQFKFDNGNGSSDAIYVDNLYFWKQPSPPQTAADIFFSEYAEGTSNNKYLKIYNPSNDTVFLSNYAYPSVSNAPNTTGVYEYWNDFDVGAFIEPGGVYVVLHTGLLILLSWLMQMKLTHIFLTETMDML